MLRMPAPKGKAREMLLIYGMHASIERMFGVAEFLNKYGGVTLPDLPGMGGMQPFYKIGEKPSLDNMADYLAAFVKMRYKRRKVTIIAMSLGFPVVTRMLQRFPELARKVELLVSMVGFVHYEEFIYPPRKLFLMRYGASILSNRLPSLFLKHVSLRPAVIRASYQLAAERNVKIRGADEAERKLRIDFEINLWRINDIRTYMDTAVTMFTLNLVNEQVDLPVYHISVAEDRYFNNHTVEQHLGVIYSKVTVIKAHMKQHAPTVIADAKAASELVPPKLRRLLNAKSQNSR